jgi:hypothetical protein
LDTGKKMIRYSNLNFPENGHPMWLSINLQRVDQWSMIFQLQDLAHEAVEHPECDWLCLGDRFLALENAETQQLLASAISRAKHVVINDLVHNFDNQHYWLEEGLPTWMPHRDYILVTNSRTRFEPKPWLRIYHYDFLFNRTKAYYSGFPFMNAPWYYAGHENYRAPSVRDNADQKSKIFLAPCRLYLDQDRTLFRKRLFDLMSHYPDDGHRSGPGRVRNGAWDKSPTGLYLASTTDDPLINYKKLGWRFDPIMNKATIKKRSLAKWKGSRWGGYNPIHNDYYDDTFISIYGETIEHGDVVVITEKTYEPLIKGHFILPFGAKGLVAAVTALGFEQPRFIDYSYDLIDNDPDRFECYAEEVKRLLRIPMHRWRVLWREHLDLLRFNQRLFHMRDYDRLEIPWEPRASSRRSSQSVPVALGGRRAADRLLEN